MRSALVLSGGGAKGAAHIGVLKILEDRNYRFDFLCGVSAGALVIGFIAVGYTADEIWKILRKTNIFFDLFDFSKNRTGLIQGDKIIDFLQSHLGDLRIEEIEIPLWIGATDFSTGDRVLLSRGSLVDAIRASISVPAVFAPHFHSTEKRWLVDGGLTQNFPLDVAIEKYDGEKIIGVDAASWVDPTHDFDQKKTHSIRYILDRTLRIFLQNQQRNFPKDPRVQIIRPKLNGYTSYDVLKLKEIYREGIETTQKLLAKVTPDHRSNRNTPEDDFRDP